jgi:hypothetical protein
MHVLSNTLSLHQENQNACAVLCSTVQYYVASCGCGVPMRHYEALCSTAYGIGVRLLETWSSPSVPVRLRVSHDKSQEREALNQHTGRSKIEIGLPDKVLRSIQVYSAIAKVVQLVSLQPRERRP